MSDSQTMKTLNPIVLDTEITDLRDFPEGRLIAIAAFRLGARGRARGHFHTLIDPGIPISENSTRICGLKDADVKGKPTFKDIADELLQFIGRRPLIAHHAEFELHYLNGELELVGRPRIDPARMTDTLATAKAKWPGVPNSLNALCLRLHVPPRKGKPDLLADVRTLGRVYNRMQSLLGLTP
jgi:DNA polymerase III subunit epsilon